MPLGRSITRKHSLFDFRTDTVLWCGWVCMANEVNKQKKEEKQTPKKIKNKKNPMQWQSPYKSSECAGAEVRFECLAEELKS